MPASQIRNRKTPGVYVTELPAFPPSVVGVATAIPIFIGYTEKAAVGGRPVINRPVPIDSLAAYEEVFGRGYPAVYNLEEVATPTGNNFDFQVLDPGDGSPRTVSYRLTAAGLTGSPGSTSTEEGQQKPGSEPAPAQSRFNLYNSMRLFYANGGANCYVVSVGTYGSDGVTLQPLLDGLAAAAEQVGPTMIVVPDAVLLPPENPEEKENQYISSDFATLAKEMLGQASRLQDRIAILDVYGTQYVNSSDHPAATLDTVIPSFHEAVGDEGLSYGAAYFPFLDTSVIPLTDFSYLNIAPTATLQAILRWEAARLYGPAPESGGTDARESEGGGKPQGNAGAADTPARPKTVHDYIEDIKDTRGGDEAVRLNQNLLAALPVLKTIEQRVIAKNNVLPPSAAMAGVYTRVDADSGVWNAPANVALAGVNKPTLRVNAGQQENLNMPVNGKAVDVLRAFPGRGTVVWGARTLDGNSPDFRYVQVRRTLIYLEQSIKAALEPFVFAPNTGQTWATVTSMVSGFLTGVWARGGLMGATPADAFSVACGLGSTMTGNDVLDGYMIVQVTLSLIRPAEFIELTFKQTMQGVG